VRAQDLPAFELGYPRTDLRRQLVEAVIDLQFARDEGEGFQSVDDTLRGAMLVAGGTSRFPQTPSTGPLARTGRSAATQRFRVVERR
jgi:hypothetical protein